MTRGELMTVRTGRLYWVFFTWFGWGMYCFAKSAALAERGTDRVPNFVLPDKAELNQNLDHG